MSADRRFADRADQIVPVVRVAGLNRSFGGPAILDDLRLEIDQGAFVALLGKSGSGKSTLLRTLAGLDDAPAGVVQAPDNRAVVFQEPRLLPWERVWRNLTLGLEGRELKAKTLAALEEVGLGHRAEAWPVTLSGGEAQRVALARALIRDPALLLLDEPFGALDALTRMKMQSLVRALYEIHRPAVLMVTHDVDEAILLADRILVLDQGRLAHDIAVDIVRPRNLHVREFSRLRDMLLGYLGADPLGIGDLVHDRQGG